ncbi:NADPH-dependent FMN reductase [Sulfobacillus thermosulfidooxidans]|uniref:NADPH-dependent FMN reductase n=1 Tax=Sulfobacillus thermosulfidooxidans TaxID=28034 RepID=UPI00031F9C56|nr:NADPH-dependent FMN reductase [Sulfobacillus thermosulfidooxidans]
MRVLLLSGSARIPSHTRSLIDAVAAELGRLGAETVTWDLASDPLPDALADFHRAPETIEHPETRRFIREVGRADAFVWGSPNYHNSYSARLKNALDTVNYDHFEQKPIGLVTHSGGLVSTQAVDHLRIVARGLLGVAIPTQIASCDADFTQEPDGTYTIAAPALQCRIVRFCAELTKMATLLSGGGVS